MKLLLLDCPNLCYRSFYTTGKQLDNGTTFGFLRELSSLRKMYPSHQPVFCWDHGEPLRKVLLPNYKSGRENKRKDMLEEDRSKYLWMKVEMKVLKQEVVHELGYNNIRWQQGFEADDLIAQACKRLGDRDEAVIVSGDSDLYQCLSHRRVIIHKPIGGKIYTERDLMNDYELAPIQWHVAKAIAGCSSDDIPGVVGVGMVTVIKYLTGKLKLDSGMYKRIQGNEKVWLLNQTLTRLPYTGTRDFDVVPDESDLKARWRNVTKTLGMASLLGVMG